MKNSDPKPDPFRGWGQREYWETRDGSLYHTFCFPRGMCPERRRPIRKSKCRDRCVGCDTPIRLYLPVLTVKRAKELAIALNGRLPRRGYETCVREGERDHQPFKVYLTHEGRGFRVWEYWSVMPGSWYEYRGRDGRGISWP